MSRPNSSAITRCTLRVTASALSPLPSTMLPLCTYVRTSSKPVRARAARSAGIATRLREPMLIPRRRTMCCVTYGISHDGALFVARLPHGVHEVAGALSGGVEGDVLLRREAAGAVGVDRREDVAADFIDG